MPMLQCTGFRCSLQLLLSSFCSWCLLSTDESAVPHVDQHAVLLCRQAGAQDW